MSFLIKQKQIENLLTDLQGKALDSAVVKKSNNLSDVTPTTARTNLDVYSKSEVQAMVAGADNAQSVANIAGRNALTGLKITDRIFVTDDGDGKWALYIVTAITNGLGSTSTFVKIADEDIFTNALSASGIKVAYESNPDTNAFTDAEQTKLSHITVTQAVNLDTIESGLASTTTTANNALSTANSAASSAANAQTAANNALSVANSKQDPFTEVREDFSGFNIEPNMDIVINLAHALAPGFIPKVYFNGLQVDNLTFTTGQSTLTITVPYQAEVADVISVYYCYV